MKKRNFVTYLGLASLVLCSLWSVPVGADAGTGKRGDTSITFQSPSSGMESNLKILNVPTLDFGSKNLQSQFSGPFTTTGIGVIEVENTTGDDDGYRITAKASSLNYGNYLLPVTSFTLNVGDGIKNKLGGSIQGTKGRDVSVKDRNEKIATGDKDANGTLSSGTVSSSLSVDSSQGIKANKYTGTIDYEIQHNLSDN